MTDKEKILAKIESLLNETNYEPFTDEVFGRIQTLKELKSYIDSLQKAPASEDLEREYDNYFKKHEIDIVLNPYSNCKDIARHFANWQHGKDFDNLLQSEMQFPKEYYEKGKADAMKEMKEDLQTEYEKGRFDMRAEMMKDAAETTVHNCQVEGIIIDGVEIFPDGLTLDDKIYKDGDKVKIIIVKED